MNGELFSIQNATQLYDSIILPGYWQRDLDWRRRGRSFARHHRRRPIAATLNFGQLCRSVDQTFFHAIGLLGRA